MKTYLSRWHVAPWSLCALLLTLLPLGARAEGPEPVAAPVLVDSGVELVPGSLQAEVLPEHERRRRWYIFLGVINAYPKLESEQAIKKYFDPIMDTIAPGYDRVTTVTDLRNLGLLWQPQFGVGYVVNDYLALAAYGGYAEGKVRTEQTDRSILLLPLHTDLEIRRGAAYFGLSADVSPFGTAPLMHYETFLDRLKGIRPTIGGRLTMTYAMFKSRIRVQLQPFENIGINLSDYWLIPSVGLNAGFTMPINERQQFATNFGYNWFKSESDDFNAWSLSMEWRYFVK